MPLSPVMDRPWVAVASMIENVMIGKLQQNGKRLHTLRNLSSDLTQLYKINLSDKNRVHLFMTNFIELDPMPMHNFVDILKFISSLIVTYLSLQSVP
jgi:hypothetical protein